jgi:DNA-binding NtrC family response regulator
MQLDGDGDGNGAHARDGDGKGPHKPSTGKNRFFTTLVVDGRISFEDFLQEFFKSEGHFILRAESAQQALELCRQNQPDLILLDNELNGVTGLALMGELLMEQASAAVIMMARHPSVFEAVEAMKRGAVDYLERPLDLRRLKQAIDTQKLLFHV